MRELGYVPNRAARSLVTNRSDSVAVVIPEPTTQVFGDPFFPRILRGISEAIAEESMQLVLLMPQARQDEERVEHYLAAGHADGVLLISLHGSDPLPGEPRRRGIPFVVGGRPHGSGHRVRRRRQPNRRRRCRPASARWRSTEGGHHRRPAGHGPWCRSARRLSRRIGADKGRGRDEAVEIADFTLEGGRLAMERLLAREPAIDAVFVASDLMAVGALAALRAAGRTTPGDVAVVGFDDSPLASTTQPRSRASGSRSRRWAAR